MRGEVNIGSGLSFVYLIIPWEANNRPGINTYLKIFKCSEWSIYFILIIQREISTDIPRDLFIKKRSGKRLTSWFTKTLMSGVLWDKLSLQDTHSVIIFHFGHVFDNFK